MGRGLDEIVAFPAPGKRSVPAPKPRRAKAKKKQAPRLPILTTGDGKSFGTRLVKGALDIYLEGRWLPEVGFPVKAPYWVKIDEEDATVEVIRGRAPAGATQRHVHRPKDYPKTPPVINLRSKSLLRLFQPGERVMVQLFDGRLVIRPEDIPRLRLQRRQARDQRASLGLAPLVGSCFTGAGFLDEAAAEAGYLPAFGIEIVEEYAGIYRANYVAEFGVNPIQVPVHTGGVATVVANNFENLRTEKRPLLPWGIELLVGGIPCQPYSNLGAGHGDVIRYWELAVARGDRKSAALAGLAPRFMQVVQHTNPYNVVVEQVAGFKGTQAHHELTEFLLSMGYYVDFKILDPYKTGAPAGRERFVLIATTDKPTRSPWPSQGRKGSSAWSVLTPPARISSSLSRTRGGWFTLGEKGKGKRAGKEAACTGPPYVTGNEARPGSYLWCPDGSGLWQRKGFKPTLIHKGTTRVGGITKGYYAPQPEGNYVAHPANKSKPGPGWKPLKGDRYRLLTIGEIRALHGVPEDFILDTTLSAFGKTRAVSAVDQCAVLGQGVVIPLFTDLISKLPMKPVSRRRVSSNPSDHDWSVRWRLGL